MHSWVRLVISARRTPKGTSDSDALGMCAQDISNDLWIIGVIAAAALVLSCVMSLIYFLFSLCGGAGSHICCAAVPVG